MKKHAARKTAGIYMVLESILNLATIPVSLATLSMSLGMISQMTALEMENVDEQVIQALQEIYDPKAALAVAVPLFLILAGVRIIRGLRLRESRGEEFFRLSIGQAAGFALCAVLLLILSFTPVSTMIVSVISAPVLIAGRVYSALRDRRIRNIVPNVIAAVACGCCGIQFMFICVLFFLLAVFALLYIVFSRISFDVLRKIMVKTHALEIICGLILLIVTFALLLMFFEPGMADFKDALWYCFAIVTTIGFGDLTAVTDFGRILSVILGIYGIVVVALITSIIVNFYGEVKTPPEEKESGDAQEDGEDAGD